MSLEVHDLRLSVAGRPLFRDLSLVVEPRRSVAIMGPSGSGKTSLLHAIAGLLPLDGGSIEVDGVAVSSLAARDRDRHRLRCIGMVFQDSELLPELTVVENAELPARLMRQAKDSYRPRALRALHRVGLDGRADSWPSELSGGERQRVGVARALSNDPALILADEPTGALDHGNAMAVAEILVGLAHHAGKSVVIATHDPDVAMLCDTTFNCVEGTVESPRSLVR